MITERELYDMCSVTNSQAELDEIESCLTQLDVNLMHWEFDGLGGVPYSKTALCNACINENINMVKLLLTHPDIDTNKKDTDGRSPLYTTCIIGHMEIATILLQDKRVLPDEESDTRYSPLFTAIRHGHPEIVELILTLVENVRLTCKSNINLYGFVKAQIAFEIITEFKKDYPMAKRNLLKKKRIASQHDSAQILLLSILCDDGFLRLQTVESVVNRFFEILMKLPMEIQMRLCNLSYGVNKEFVSESNIALELKMLKKEKFLV